MKLSVFRATPDDIRYLKSKGITTIAWLPDDPLLYNLTSHIPDRFALEQNYPNPSNPLTVIRCQLPATGWITLEVYDLLGQEVATLINGVEEVGYKSVAWNASGRARGHITIV